MALPRGWTLLNSLHVVGVGGELVTTTQRGCKFEIDMLVLDEMGVAVAVIEGGIVGKCSCSCTKKVDNKAKRAALGGCVHQSSNEDRSRHVQHHGYQGGLWKWDRGSCWACELRQPWIMG